MSAKRTARLDGLGQPIDPAALYYVQDRRTCVGNCASWWAPNGAGYVCRLDEAGKYPGARTAGMRDTDISWPCAYVEARVVRHVRADQLHMPLDAIQRASGGQ